MTFQKEKLSVFDKSKLNEIVWTKDVCDFSLGLFLPPSLAWKGIKEFKKTGTTSTKIERILPDDIPMDGKIEKVEYRGKYKKG